MNALIFKHFPVSTHVESLIDFYLIYQGVMDNSIRDFNHGLFFNIEESFLSFITEEYDLYGESYHVTVVMSGDIPVGFMTYSQKETCHVSALWVNPKFRRQGIGKSLIGTLKNIKCPITLFVQKNAYPTQEFYSELSFKRVNEFKRSYLLERAPL